MGFRWRGLNQTGFAPSSRFDLSGRLRRRQHPSGPREAQKAMLPQASIVAFRGNLLGKGGDP